MCICLKCYVKNCNDECWGPTQILRDECKRMDSVSISMYLCMRGFVVQVLVVSMYDERSMLLHLLLYCIMLPI